MHGRTLLAALAWLGLGAMLMPSSPSRAEGPWIADGPPGGALRALAAAPFDARVLYALVGPAWAADGSNATPPAALARSHDGGDTWKRLRTPLGFLETVALDALHPDVVYVVAGDWNGRERIWRSGDGGSHWLPTRFDPLLDGRPTFAVVPSEGAPAVLLLSAGDAWSSRLLRSTDEGTSWQEAAPPPGAVLTAFAADPRGSGRVLAASGARIVRSEDWGGSWQVVAETGSSVSALAGSAADPARWYAATADGVLASRDGGLSWTWSDAAGPGYPAWLAVDAADPARVHAANVDTLLLSSDGAATFRRMARGVPRRRSRSVASLLVRDLAAQPGRVLVATERGLFRSTDGGLSYRPAALLGLSAQTIDQVRFDPFDGAHAVVETEDGAQETRDGGVTWRAFAPSLGRVRVTDVLFDRTAPGSLWAVFGEFGDRLARSDDGGGTWRVRAAPQSFLGAMALVGPDTLLSAYAGRSVDGGRHWASWTLPFPVNDPFNCSARADRFVVDGFAHERVVERVAAIGGEYCRHGEHTPQAVLSSDAGASWHSLPNGTSAVAFDPDDGRRALVASAGVLRETFDDGRTLSLLHDFEAPVVDALALPGGAVLVVTHDDRSAQPRSAVWRSGDGGRTWRSWSAGLPMGSPGLLCVDPRAPRRVLVTPDSGGIYRRSLE